MTYGAEARATIRSLFRDRNYRLLFTGQGMALLGEQVSFIALPWLTLQLTGDPVALGSLLALNGLPPAVLMLFGGATTDRLSPRTLMLLVDAVRAALILALVIFVLVGSVGLWLLYPLSLCLGLLSAFSLPAASSITRTLLPDRDLQAGNSFFQSLTMVAAILGPALGGFLLKLGGASGTGSAPASGSIPTLGLALAFGVYGIGLAISVVTLWRIRTPTGSAAPAGRERSNMFRDMADGLGYAWRDPMLRLLILVLLALNLLVVGPFGVGVPIISKVRLAEGAAGFGLIMSVYAVGSLAGYLLAGLHRRSRGMALALVALLATFGLGMFALTWIRALWPGLIIPFVLGAGNGYMGIILRTLLQQRSPRDLVGRVMSLYLFGRLALAPVSNLVSGVIINWSLDGLFWGAGVLLLALAAAVAVSPVPRLLEQQVEIANRGAQALASHS